MDGRTPAPPKKLWNDDSLVNTSANNGFNVVQDSVRPQQGMGGPLKCWFFRWRVFFGRCPKPDLPFRMPVAKLDARLVVLSTLRTAKAKAEYLL